MHVGYLISQSAPCKLAMSKRKSYCVSFKLKVLETAEKKSKEAAAREFGVDPRRSFRGGGGGHSPPLDQISPPSWR